MNSNPKWFKRYFLFSVLMSVMLYSHQGLAASNTGGLESPFEMGASAQILGMGEAGVALVENSANMDLNPAILAGILNQQIATFHTTLFLDTSYDALSYDYPTRMGTLGFQVIRLSSGNINETTTSIVPVGTFSDEQIQGSLGYGTEIVQGFYGGVALNYEYESIDVWQDTGVGANVGGLYVLASSRRDLSDWGWKNFSIGFSISNLIQPSLKLFENVDTPARVYRMGLTYHYLSTNFINSIWISAEDDMIPAVNSTVHLGLEYEWNNLLLGRVGYDGSNPTFGFGVNWHGFQFDYAWNHPALGMLNLFSLSYSFGRIRSWWNLQQWKKEHRILKRQQEQLHILTFIAQNYERVHDLIHAMVAWKNVLKQFPKDVYAQTQFRKITIQFHQALQLNLREAEYDKKTGHTQSFVKHVTNVLRLDPSNTKILHLLQNQNQQLFLEWNYLRGLEAEEAHNYQKAVEYFGIVYHQDPYYRQIRELWTNANSHYLPIESLSPQLGKIYAQGVKNFLDGNYREAIHNWEQILKKEPNNFLIQRNVRDAKQRLRRKESHP